MLQVDRQTFEEYKRDLDKKDHLLRGHSELDLLAYDRMDDDERKDVKKVLPARYHFIEREGEIERMVQRILEDENGELNDLKKELFSRAREREQQRELMDRISFFQKRLLRILNLKDISLGEQGLRLLQQSRTWERVPQGGYFRSDKELLTAITEAQKMAYIKARERMLLALKHLLYEQEQREQDPDKKKRLRIKRRFVSIMYMRYRSFELAKEHHSGQFRKTGEAYVFHPDEMAILLFFAGRHKLRQLRPTPDFLSLLPETYAHDWMEDCDVSQEEIEEIFFHEYYEAESFRLDKNNTVEKEARRFGQEIARVVDLVSEKDRKGREKSAREQEMINRIEAESNPKFRLRALLIKIADRMYNLDTLRKLPDIERIRTKLRSTVDWCLFFSEMEKTYDLFDLPDLLNDMTWLDYNFILFVKKIKKDDIDDEKLEQLLALVDPHARERKRKPQVLSVSQPFMRPRTRTVR